MESLGMFRCVNRVQRDYPDLLRAYKTDNPALSMCTFDRYYAFALILKSILLVVIGSLGVVYKDVFNAINSLRQSIVAAIVESFNNYLMIWGVGPTKATLGAKAVLWVKEWSRLQSMTSLNSNNVIWAGLVGGLGSYVFTIVKWVVTFASRGSSYISAVN
eukprot:scaffold140795_cov33-Tisochrysis_lutea.AAC.1